MSGIMASATNPNIKVAMIYRPPGVITQSREVLTDNASSSIPHGSTISLPVVREQYCSCIPQTRLEKRLVIVIAILVLFILLLLVAVSILADRERSREVGEVVEALTVGEPKSLPRNI